MTGHARRLIAAAAAERARDAGFIATIAEGVALAGIIETALEEAVAQEREECAALADLPLEKACPTPNLDCDDCKFGGYYGDGRCIGAAIRARGTP